MHHCSYFFVGFAKHLGPEMPFYFTITKSGLPIHGTTSALSAKKKNVQGKMSVVVNFVFVQVSDGLIAMVRGKPRPKVNTDSSNM